MIKSTYHKLQDSDYAIEVGPKSVFEYVLSKVLQKWCAGIVLRWTL